MTAHTAGGPPVGTAGVTAAGDTLWTLVEAWQGAAADAVALLRSLEVDDWGRPTDLPGWDVHAVAAHLAHLESVLAGAPQDPPGGEAVELAGNAGGPSHGFTEAGVRARAGWSAARVVDELEVSVARRHAALLADAPTDLSAPAPGFAGALGWTWQRLLTNRPVDLWMHEQDVRRAVGRPGNLTSLAARHTTSVFAAALPFVLGRKVRPPVGTTLVLEVTGALPQVYAAAVGEEGRGVPVPPPAHPTAQVTLDLETWIVLSGGRRSPDAVPVTVSGDEELARHTVAALAVTT